MITTYIKFPNDLSVGLFPETYEMQIPDPREDWTETDEELNKFLEEQREAIRQLYLNFQNDGNCGVTFDFELEQLNTESDVNY